MSGVQSGPYNPQPANLLGMASQAQDIQRSQLAVQTGKQALANTQQNEFAQHLFAVNQLPDAQVVPWAQQLLQHAISTGTMDPQHEGMFGDIINSGDVGKIRTLANLGAIGNLAGPDAMNALARPVNVVNTGGALTNVTSPSTAERLPFAPGGANPQPTFGASTPTTLSPEGQAAQVARPATTQDVSDFAARGVTIQPGQAITENMRQRLLQQGGGGLLPGATPGAPGPQAPAFAPPAVPQRTVPPMAASGQPIGPQNPAGLGGGAQGAVVTGLPPSQPAEVAASADLFNKEQASSADFFTRDQQQGAALGALRTASTGPGTDFTNHLKSFALAMAPDVASGTGIDPTKIANFDTAKKYLTAIATSTPGAAGSDLRTSLSQMSNPSTEISNKAATHIMATIQGLSRMRQAAFQQFAQANTVQGTGVNGVPPQLVPGASQNFGAFATSFSAKNDYRAFTPMTDDEFQAQIKSLTPQERPRFAASYAIAKQEGFQE